MKRGGIFFNRDGSTEAWDGENYVPLGSMRGDDVPRFPSRVIRRSPRRVPRPPRVWSRPGERHDPQTAPLLVGLYLEVEEYPPVTISEFKAIAEDRRVQERRKRRFRTLLLRAAELAARVPEADGL